MENATASEMALLGSKHGSRDESNFYHCFRGLAQILS